MAAPVAATKASACSIGVVTVIGGAAIVEGLKPSTCSAAKTGVARAKGRVADSPSPVSGSAAHASHAVNDYRKLCGFEAYAPTDNVSELTARANDEGWDTPFTEWLRGSRLSERDALLVFSVGGGDRERGVRLISPPGPSRMERGSISGQCPPDSRRGGCGRHGTEEDTPDVREGLLHLGDQALAS